MKKLLLLLSIISLSIPTFAQYDTASSYQTLDSIFLLNYKQGNFDQCIKFSTILLKKSSNTQGVKDSIKYTRSIADMGFVYWYMGLYQKSKTSYLKALELQRILYGEESVKYMQTLNNLAVLYHEMGSYDQAEPLYLKTNSFLYKKLGENNLNFAKSLNNLATLYQDMGAYQQAEPLLIQAKNIKKLSIKKDPMNYASSLNNLAYLYQDMKQLKAAEDLFLEAKHILQKLNSNDERRLLAQTINNLASLYQEKKNFEQAERNFQQALELKNKVYGSKHPSVAISISNLARLYQDMKQLKKAETLFRKTISLRATIFGTEHPSYSESLCNLALLYYQQEKPSIALHYALKSIAANTIEFDSTLTLNQLLNNTTSKTIKYYSNQQCLESFSVLLKIIRAQTTSTPPSVPLKDYKRLAQVAMQINQEIRHQLSNDKDKLRTIKKNTLFIEHGIESALWLGNKQDINDAFLFAELNKSILLAEAINDNQAKNLGDLPDSLALQERKLLEKLDALEKKQLELKVDTLLQQNNKEIANLQLEIRDFIRSLKDKYPKYHALKYENITANVTEIQAILSDNKQGDFLLLEYFQTNEILYLFVLSKNSIQLFPLPITKEALSKKIHNLRYSLSSYRLVNTKQADAFRIYAETAHWFYKNILEIALQGKEENRLIIVTDGELGHLPFGTFLTSPITSSTQDYKDLDYLMNDFSISYNYSSTLWKENKAITNKNNEQILAYAADYPPIDSSITPLRLPQVIRLRKKLLPLDAAQEEVKFLEKAFKGDFLYGNAANERAFKANASNYGIIHLAMHGVLNPKHPMLSSLAFTENKDSLEDNFLQAYEIARLQLNADLIVLSACETGYGKFEEGEGIISLARSFMYAGTPSLVVSLWSVNDFSTSFVMDAFYQYLKQGLPKDKALRNAKLDYLQQIKGPAAHPAYWSPFIQIGDSEAIGFLSSDNNNNLWKFLLGGILVFLLFVRIYFKKN